MLTNIWDSLPAVNDYVAVEAFVLERFLSEESFNLEADVNLGYFL